jgi:hypothetical protein
MSELVQDSINGSGFTSPPVPLSATQRGGTRQLRLYCDPLDLV